MRLGAGSFFFKPSFYTIFAPAIVLTYPLFRRRLQWQGIAGLAADLAPAADVEAVSAVGPRTDASR